MRILAILWISLASFTSWASTNAINSTLPIEAADCLIVDHDNNILMIEEALSGKLSIPGGSIIGKETPQEAAKRETLEETGLNVDVGEKIAQTYNSAVYACKVLGLPEYYDDANGQRQIYAWHAPHFGKEVTRVMLMPDDGAMRAKYRFPEHKWMFDKWVKFVEPSRFRQTPDAHSELTAFYDIQLAWLEKLRAKTFNGGLSSLLGNVVVLTGSIITPLFFLLMLPLVRTLFGHRALLIFSAGMLTLATVTLMLSTVIHVPRPLSVDPYFTYHDVLGFTLPSSMVALTTFTFSCAWLFWDEDKYPKKRLWVAAVGVVLVGASSLKALLLGEHYPSDMIISILLGVLAAFALLKVKDWRFADRSRVLTSTRFWGGAFVVVAVIGSIIHKPQLIYLSGLTLGAFCALIWLKVSPVYISPVRRRYKIAFFAIASGGIFALMYLDKHLTANTAINEIIVLWNCIALWSISVWLLVVLPRLFYRYVKR
ncbi:bifunctional NUDIX hydrolase/phosphatase PAP2 family protein [Enterovibrio coralii]|uniref:DNA mismatch repair protein MutT n=1 Tax=Enterovibrio coralii TaxID=294935 RepID=A0A135I8G0_9GAMM|nr:bifunctional NUDIX hydrolase/phosphatase PAP2 family protein [Enterovibrio coralii]KXF81735.1 DNA mismatch repair protein MutT [Enterovibrio coralii]